MSTEPRPDWPEEPMDDDAIAHLIVIFILGGLGGAMLGVAFGFALGWWWFR